MPGGGGAATKAAYAASPAAERFSECERKQARAPSAVAPPSWAADPSPQVHSAGVQIHATRRRLPARTLALRDGSDRCLAAVPDGPGPQALCCAKTPANMTNASPKLALSSPNKALPPCAQHAKMAA